jgi:hypothetical protein
MASLSQVVLHELVLLSLVGLYEAWSGLPGLELQWGGQAVPQPLEGLALAELDAAPDTSIGARVKATREPSRRPAQPLRTAPER